MPWLTCGGQDNLQESVLSFHHVGLRDGTQVVSLEDKHLNLLSHLTGLAFKIAVK